MAAAGGATDFEVITDCFGQPISRWTTIYVPALQPGLGPRHVYDGIMGTSGDDRIHGEGGNDNAIPCAGGGEDTVFGDLGNDQIDGEGGHDILFGNENEDEIHAGPGHDTIDAGDHREASSYGGNGEDEIHGGGCTDSLYGQDDDDEVHCGEDADRPRHRLRHGQRGLRLAQRLRDLGDRRLPRAGVRPWPGT